MKFILNKDTLTIENEDLINSGSVNYYEADVEYDESWNDLTIKAILRRRGEDEGIAIAVVGNKMFIDKEQLTNERDCETYYIGFVGYTIENEKKTYQISTKLESFYVIRGAGEIETQESELPTPTEWELYIAQIEKIANEVSDEISKETMIKVQPQLDEIREIADTAGETAETAISIAKGANQSLSFGDYATMVSVFNSLNNDIYRTGQNILIVTLNVPDLWVSAIAEESISYDYTIDEDLINLLKEQGFVQVGYYKLSQLETQKVDLKDYQKATELEERPFEITYKDGTTETLRSVVYK